MFLSSLDSSIVATIYPEIGTEFKRYNFTPTHHPSFMFPTNTFNTDPTISFGSPRRICSATQLCSHCVNMTWTFSIVFSRKQKSNFVQPFRWPNLGCIWSTVCAFVCRGIFLCGIIPMRCSWWFVEPRCSTHRCRHRWRRSEYGNCHSWWQLLISNILTRAVI